MGLFSAVVKGLARSANDTFANHQRKKAKKIAYKKRFFKVFFDTSINLIAFPSKF